MTKQKKSYKNTVLFKESPLDISIVHGKLSHMIQAWLIIKFLGVEDGAKLIRLLVQERDWSGRPLWNDLLDKALSYDIKNNGFTFSESFCLNAFLMTNEEVKQELPLLSAYLRAIFFSEVNTFTALESKKMPIDKASSPTATVVKLAMSSQTFSQPLASRYIKANDIKKYWRKKSSSFPFFNAGKSVSDNGIVIKRVPVQI